MNHPVVLLLLAFALDLLIGDPPYPSHPVRLMGRLIGILEEVLRKFCTNLTLASLLLQLLALLFTSSVYLFMHRLFGPLSWLIDLYLIYSMFALGDLIRHGRATELALAHQTLEEARNKVQWMVGRDTSLLDAHGVARAAIESVAENFVDGFLSPLFWFVTGMCVFRDVEGTVLLLIGFKMISTLDSMVGYRNEQYRQLGKFSAKLDDVMNFIPARLGVPLITLAARLVSEDWKAAWRIGLRDRLKHASPNSAHAEAAMAGALNLRLGGPTIYPQGTVEKPWLGNGSAEAVPNDIERALKLTRACGYIAVIFSVLTLI